MEAKIAEARQKLMARGAADRAGGVRRKTRAAKPVVAEDKKFGALTKRYNFTPLPNPEAVTFFHKNGLVSMIDKPQVEGAFGGNCFVVRGACSEPESIMTCLPKIFSHLGPEALSEVLQFSKDHIKTEESDDENIPELVENFEEAAKKDE